jgi:hypothetical protein
MRLPDGVSDADVETVAEPKKPAVLRIRPDLPEGRAPLIADTLKAAGFRPLFRRLGLACWLPPKTGGA